MTDLQDRVLVEYEIHSPAPSPIFKAISGIFFQKALGLKTILAHTHFSKLNLSYNQEY